MPPKWSLHLFTARPLCPTVEHTSPTRGATIPSKKKSGLVGVDGREQRREGSKSWARSVSDFLHSVSNQTFPQYHTLQQHQGKTNTRQPGIGGVKTTEVTNQGCVTSSSSNSKNHRITLSPNALWCSYPAAHMSGGKCIVLYHKHLNFTQPHASSRPPSTDL